MVPIKVISSAVGHFKLDEKETGETILALLKPFTEGVKYPIRSSALTWRRGTFKEAQSLPQLKPMRWSHPGEEIPGTETHHQFSPKRKSQRFHSLSEGSQLRHAQRANSTRAKCKTKFKGRMDDVARSTTLGDLITTDHTILNVGNESRCGHRNADIVKKDCTTR